MIASVSGIVADVAGDSAVIEVGGVGLSVQCAPGTLASLAVGAPARLATSLVVREDSLTLYGFADDSEKQLFELLQTASGVGPRLAQAVLAVLAPDAVRKAIANSEIAVLTQVPGIGKKGAERICLELRDKVGPIPVGASAPGRPGVAKAAWPDQIRQGLLSLGWTASQAETAVVAVGEDVDRAIADGMGIPPVPVLLRAAIRHLGQPARSSRSKGGAAQ
jgi:holliday junction DNA helicase RuvA